jgi:hypothetical protein
MLAKHGRADSLGAAYGVLLAVWMCWGGGGGGHMGGAQNVSTVLHLQHPAK